jgi:hypothetical protein
LMVFAISRAATNPQQDISVTLINAKKAKITRPRSATPAIKHCVLCESFRFKPRDVVSARWRNGKPNSRQKIDALGTFLKETRYGTAQKTIPALFVTAKVNNW